MIPTYVLIRISESRDIRCLASLCPAFRTIAPVSLSRQIMRFGFPGLDNVRSQSDFVLSYDRRARVPQWVFEHLTAESVRRNDEVDRAGCGFTPDTSIHPYFRSVTSLDGGGSDVTGWGR